MKTPILFALVLWSGITVAAGQAHWPQWRGPSGDGSLPEGKTPTEFGPGKNLKWQTELPGRGCSTPVAWGDTIFLTGPDGDEDAVMAFGLDGKEKWRKTVGEAMAGKKGRTGSSANSSPLTDGERVYAFFKSGNVAALTMAGELLWSTNIWKEYGENKLWWDNGTSPVLAGGNLVIAVMQTDAPSYVVALDAKTGKKSWKVDRNFDVGTESGDAYTTPHVITDGDREVVVCYGGDHLTGHDAKTGEQLWFAGGYNPEKTKMWRIIASSVLVDDVVVGSFGRGSLAGGVKVGGSGDVTKDNWLWRKELEGSDAVTPVVRDGKVYIVSDVKSSRGKLTCIEAKTGEVVWQDQLPKAAQTYYSSPIMVGNKLYAIRENGAAVCAIIGEKGIEEATVNELGENVVASPIVVNDMLIIRTDESLMAFGE